jgi:hypothetical protein
VTPGRGHVVGRGPRELHRREQVGIEILAEHVDAAVQDPRSARAAHAKEKVVEAAEDSQALADGPFPFAGASQVGRHASGRRGPRRPFQALERPPHALARPADDEHAGAGRRQVPGDDEPEARRAARHHHPPVTPHES